MLVLSLPFHFLMLMLWDILQRDLHGKELRVASVQKLMRNEELMTTTMYVSELASRSFSVKSSAEMAAVS